MNVVIVGCGLVGSGLARTLSLGGHATAVIDRDPAAFSRLGPGFAGRTLEGNGLDRAVLLAAGIERCDGLAAATSSDETNIVAALVARRVFRVPKVAARVFEPRKADIYRRLGLRTVSPVSLGVHHLAEMLSVAELTTVTALGAGDVEIVALEATPAMAGRTAAELGEPGLFRLTAVGRVGRTFIPEPATVVAEGDHLYLAVLHSSVSRLKDALGLS